MPPRSRAKNPIVSTWLAIRFSSVAITRMYSCSCSGHLDIEQLLERHDRRPLAEERGDVFERVGVADRLVVVGVLAELLHAAVEVPEHRVDVHDALAVDLEDDAEDAVRGRVMRPHVQEHLAITERVELRLALGAADRDLLHDALAEDVLDPDARVVQGGVRTGGRAGRGHRSAPR